ncbi:Two-component sensor histidine kinase [Magnetospirillum sp. LM-5]|nr:Two-component sensor histidine kinase [Magnetospirillum sp. LM-5]
MLVAEQQRKDRNDLVGSRAVIVLGAILVAAVLLITSYEIWRQRTVALSSSATNLEALAVALAEQTERSIRNVETVIDAVLESIDEGGGIENANSADMHRELRERAVGVPQIAGIGLVDSTGLGVNTLVHWPTPPFNVADRDYFQFHRDHADKAAHIGALTSGRLSDREMITISKRISGRDGSFKGVVLATILPGFFHEFYARVLPPTHNSAVALFRIDGMLLARVPEAPGTKLGKSYAHLPDFQPGEPRSGLVRGPSPMDGAMRMVAFQTLERYPLKLNLSLDEGQLLASWRGNTLRLAAFGVTATILLTSMVFLLVRHMRGEEQSVRQLRDSENRLRLAQFTLDHAADMVFWATMDGRVIYANRAACERTNVTVEEASTVTVAELDPAFSPEMWQGHLATLRRDGTVRYEAVHRPRKGRPFPVDVVITTVMWEGQESLCAFVRDITDRKQAEAALAEQAISLEASNAELEQFAYVASHDLREPLRMVNSFVTMLSKRYGDKLDDEARDYIAFAQDGAVRMDRLILDLLEYSRVGRLDRPLVPTPLGQCIDLACRNLLLAIDESGAAIDRDTDFPMVMANEEELVRLLVNLIANALKYRAPDRAPRITIGAERRDDDILVTIADNGIGIAPEYFERIFRIFQRLHGRDRYEGTGIGLAICKKIVERHGGRIWVESVPDQGSCFYFTLKPAPTP